MKISFVIPILPVIFYQCLIVSGTAKFDVFGKSMKLWFNKEWGYISNQKDCRIQTSRQHPGGLFSCEGYMLKPIEYVYLHIQLFYRYGTIYRIYLINYKKVEPCELMKKTRSFKYSNPLADLVLLGVKTCCPLFNHECPYLPGWYNATRIDINGTVAPFLPPVVPVGQYKVYIRAYLDDNKTLAEMVGVAIIKANYANRVIDFSMLNMG